MGGVVGVIMAPTHVKAGLLFVVFRLIHFCLQSYLLNKSWL